MIGKIVAVVIVFSLLISILKKYILIPIAVVGVIILIRLLADIFWWWKDKDEW